MGDLPAGVKHLRAAHALEPDDITTIANFAKALMAVGALAEAERLCSAKAASRDRSMRIERLRGYILQARGDWPGAISSYGRVLAAAPADFEIWNNLGNAHMAAGNPAEGIAALERARDVGPGIPSIGLNLAAALTEAGREDEALAVLESCARRFPDHAETIARYGLLLARAAKDEDALRMLQRAVELAPDDADIRVALGEQYVVASVLDRAEAAFRDALSIVPDHAEAHVQIALLLDHTNRIDEYDALIDAAAEKRVGEDHMNFIRALAHRRHERFAEGLAAIGNVPDTVHPVRRAQLIGQFHDRLGDPVAAFAAFEAMNRAAAREDGAAGRRGAEFRASLREARNIVTPAWYAAWRPAPSPATPPPIFLVGFPRSGTTLLDTMLMGHPRVKLLEEQPLLRQVERSGGTVQRLADLTGEEVADLRAQYFTAAGRLVDVADGDMIVDKFPLHLNKVPLIHRLFPDARFILALRHPCDVVLSCFITSFRLNNAMANFLDLQDAAALYDLALGYWHQCLEIMPVRCHAVRYENLIVDAEAELRPVFDFLGLDWRPEILDHRRTAAARGTIKTASYAQVTEQLYGRASGRWRRYASWLEPVLPILAPWVQRLGYEL
ncbi:MAG: hypothetical protein JWO81_2012 [Alphaproteobacteria bacterium]|nr:hypothetical protein [Alphaproteobacteria bacterium]